MSVYMMSCCDHRCRELARRSFAPPGRNESKRAFIHGFRDARAALGHRSTRGYIPGAPSGLTRGAVAEVGG